MKPILTRRQVEISHCYCERPECKRAELVANTIEQAMELLREPCTCWRGEDNIHRDSMGGWICHACHRKEQLLARYDGNGKDGE